LVVVKYPRRRIIGPAHIIDHAVRPRRDPLR
jgi:hypothetical protein